MEKMQLIEVKTCNGVRVVKIESIVTIRTARRHSVITLYDGTSFEAFHSLGWFDGQLQRPDFCRCHQSHIVHCRYIESLNYTSFRLKVNGFGEVPFSRKYKPELLSRLKTYLAQN